MVAVEKKKISALSDRSFFMTSKSQAKETKAFPLPDVLRDLALLRVSDVQLASLVPNSTETSSSSPRDKELDSDLEKSYQFTNEARAAIKLRDSGKVENEAGRLESVRSGLEEFVKGIEGGSG
ncbi:hypothetical protein BT96DRAFT_640066 [Gymnopus androsaceus JB14]|uniref:Uncharacterized protein n=1 Tax=Gymnopus androsaceus JB14 TaxID=1447944 RepID=A0A6A4HQE8_9AGAR|nr:hypothetical protein BT96DRAFT_640066 [Gymnopus androsaceus JB14]